MRDAHIARDPPLSAERVITPNGRRVVCAGRNRRAGYLELRRDELEVAAVPDAPGVAALHFRSHADPGLTVFEPPIAVGDVVERSYVVDPAHAGKRPRPPADAKLGDVLDETGTAQESDLGLEVA